MFSNLLTNSTLLKNLTEKLQFTSPTPIQAAVIPPVLEGKNVYAGAKTGSGKTMAFLLPIAERMFRGEIKRALVLAPTRELVLQMDEEAAKLLDGQNEVVSIPLYGGVPIDPQILAMKHHRPRILLATPGRVIDFLQEGLLPLDEIEITVLDEADRMCDMGFAPQVTQILDQLPNRKQMLLFSATLPKELNSIMQTFCNDPVQIKVDAADTSSETITHQSIVTNRRDKLRALEKILAAPDTISIIFTKTRKKADELYRALSRDSKDFAVLHAGFEMEEREYTIRAFRDGKIRHLIATDVVSRGIDVDTITHVIHFDIPESLEDYIHRSGRSGRAGRTGTTIAIFGSDDPDQMKKLEVFSKRIKFEPLDLGLRNESRGRSEVRHEGSSSRGKYSKGSSRQTDRSPRGRSSRHEPKHSTTSAKKKTSHLHSHTNTKKVKKPSLLAKAKSLISRAFKRKKV
ncbi:MAG: DEAD/DEAH box helicase [Deltaproteobacteria bacterium]|nr:DEAD/DEAH box helicase [Deltaproteobacteria bacterium]